MNILIILFTVLFSLGNATAQSNLEESINQNQEIEFRFSVIDADISDETIDLAADAGLDTVQLLEDYLSVDVEDKIVSDLVYANELEINATPTVLVNGESIQVPNTVEDFEQILLGFEQPITVEIFEDFQCPYCGVFFPIALETEYTIEEDVEFIHYHFPLTAIHPKAMEYAKTLEAAKMQNMYIEMAKAILESENPNIDYSYLDVHIK